MDLEDKSSIAAALHKAASDRAVAALRSRLAQTTPTYPAQPQPARGIGASTWPINPAVIAHDGLASALPEPTTVAVGTAWPASQAVSAGYHGYQQAPSSTSTATGQAAETEQAKIDRILDALQMPTAPQHSTQGPAAVVANQLSTQTMQTLVFLGATARIKGQTCSEFIDSVQDTVVSMMQAPSKAADSAPLFHRLVQQSEYQAHMQQKQAAATNRHSELSTGYYTNHRPELPPLQAAQAPNGRLAVGITEDTWGFAPLDPVTQPAAASQQQHPGSASNRMAPIALGDIWGADPNPCTPIPALSPIGGLAQLHPADMDSLMAMFMDSPRHAAAAAAAPPAAMSASMHQMLMPSGWAQAALCSPRGSHMRGAAGSSTPRSLLGSLNQDRMQAHGSPAGQLASSQDASELEATLLPTIQAVPRQEPVSGGKELQPAQQLRTLQQQRAYINEQLHSKQQQQEQAQMQVQGMPGAYSASHDQAAQPPLMAGSSYGSHDVINGITAKRTVVRQSDASSNSSAITSTHPVHPAGASPRQNKPAPSALSSAEHATAGPVVGSAAWLGGTSKRPGGPCAQQQRPAKVPRFDITSTAGSAAQVIDTAADATGANTSDSNAWEQPNALVQRAIAAADQQHQQQQQQQQQQQHQQQQMVNGGQLQRTYVSHRFAIVGPAAQEGEKAVDMAQLPAAFRMHRGPILFL